MLEFKGILDITIHNRKHTNTSIKDVVIAKQYNI